MNNFYVFISKVFNLENKYKTEKEINEKLKEWENISKKLEEKKFDIEDEIKIRLIQFFNKENNKEKFRELLSEERKIEEEKKKQEEERKKKEAADRNFGRHRKKNY